MEIRSDLSNIKIGDKVFCTINGWGIITNIINDDHPYPVRVEDSSGCFHSYGKDGKYIRNAKCPSLFTYNPFEKKEFEPRWMMVSNDQVKWHKRFVIYKHHKLFIALIYADNECHLASQVGTYPWEYAKEIEQIQISMDEAIEEIARIKGVDKSLIKIK
jgi:hypothetical protein